MTGTKHRSKSSHSAQLWARAAHDLRQPVQAMLLQMQVLDRPSSRTQQKRAVHQIETALLSLQDMLEALALMSRIEAGLQNATHRIFSLADVLAPIVEQAAGAAQARGVKLRCRKTRAPVRSHPNLLAVAIRSLLLSAIELGNGDDIVAGCRRRGDDIVFEVSFSGAPLDAARGKSAFVSLSQRESKASAGGLGLGLDLLEHLCRHLGHELEARPGAGGVQVMAITLPRATTAR